MPDTDYLIAALRNWREQQKELFREGLDFGVVHGVLQVRGEQEWRAATPLLSRFEPLPNVEPPGSRAASVARLLRQGYTPNEILQITTARIKAGKPLRYRDLREEGPTARIIAEQKKALRPTLRLVPTHETRAP